MAEPRFLVGIQSVAARRARATRDGWGLAAQPTFVWRLVGPNNRELGRSAVAFRDAVACKAGISFLRRQREHLDARVWCDDAARWMWRLELHGSPVAIAGRTYMRRREAAFNLAQFLEAIPIAASPGAARPAAPVASTSVPPGPGVATSLSLAPAALTVEAAG